MHEMAHGLSIGVSDKKVYHRNLRRAMLETVKERGNNMLERLERIKINGRTLFLVLIGSLLVAGLLTLAEYAVR